jgi:hypothetical protein
MNQNYPFQTYPTKIAEPHIRVEKSDTPAERHKALLDLGESLLLYILGVLFGEYKGSGRIDKKIEADFYLSSKSKASLGIYVKYLRDHLIRVVDNSILQDKFTTPYPKTGELGLVWFTLKNLIKKKGVSGDFSGAVVNEIGDNPQFPERLLTSSNRPKKNPGGFFDIFVTIRNVHAHPGEWPLGDDYFEFINPYLHSALTEIILDLELLKDYRSLVVKNINDEKKQGTFEVEMTSVPSDIRLNLGREQLSMVTTDMRYLFDADDQLLFKFYYNSIPQLNPEVAKEIIDREKAKAMEPHMVEMIENKLADDGKIDDMEYLILRDTAKTSSISLERLFQLIEKVKNQLKVKGTVGTPDDKGDIFIELKDDDTSFSFNPWWLHYLSMVPKIDKNTVKKEQANEKKIEKQIQTLKKSKKSLPVSKRLENAKKNLKNKKGQKSKQLKSLNARIQKKREMRKKAKAPERKRALLAEIEEIKIKADEKREYFDSQINELSETVERINEEKGEKANEIDEKILILRTELDEYSKFTQWGMHKNLWQEINQYVEFLLEKNLNAGISDKTEEDEEPQSLWINTPNQWQIGALSYTYWAKIYREEAPLGMTYNVGYAISSRFKWLPKNIDDSLKDTVKKPSSIIWTTQDDQWAAKIDLDGSLGRKKAELNRNLLKDYESELLNLGANVRCKPSDMEEIIDWDKDTYFMPLEKFLKVKNEYTVESLYSRLWPVDAYYDNGKILVDAISKYEKEMVTMLQLFSNVVVQLNDYALENGINQETIDERFDQFNRHKDEMFKEFEKKYPVGTLFRPTKEEDKSWREFAAKELGLSDYLYDMIASNFRFSSGYNARKYLKEQRDKHKPDTKEYLEWNQKIKEL